MTDELAVPPVLSTPAEHLLEHVDLDAPPTESQILHRADHELRDVYEIARTAAEVRAAQRRRVALQFPDSMLGDAPRVVELLKSELSSLGTDTETRGKREERIYILADTSYSACCVDEIAAEHVDADVVVHYGRSCLSPTSRFPVIYVFTKHQLDKDLVVETFEKAFPDKEANVLVMADCTYQDHVPGVFAQAQSRGYGRILATKIVHNPTGAIPNRAIVDSEGQEVSSGDDATLDLKEYSVFHISTPPTSLLLSLSSKVKSFHIYPTPTPNSPSSTGDVPSTRAILGRRYAKVITLATAGIIGILVNTLSVSNYLSSIDAIRARIAAAGKKSYTIVVGKLNPAKLANFAEVDGWVVIGCWESGLVEDDAGYYRPVVTPFELEVALMPDTVRVWGDKWWGGIEGVTNPEQNVGLQASNGVTESEAQHQEAGVDGIDDDESEPPDFDLRTGQLVSHSRPIQLASNHTRQIISPEQQPSSMSNALTLQPKSELATIKAAVSPGAEFLRSQRTWQGLGSDFDNVEGGASIEEGRSGVARGYTVGGEVERS